MANTSFKQAIHSRLKIKKCLNHLFYADIISFCVARKCQIILKWKTFISSELLEEFQ